MMETFFLYAAIALSLIMVLSLYRAVFGPTVLDRMVGVNAIGSKTTVLLLLIGIIYQRVEMFVDIWFEESTQKALKALLQRLSG